MSIPEGPWLSTDLLAPSILRMQRMLVYLMMGLGCDMPILEAYFHGLSVVLSKQDAEIMLRRLQIHIMHFLGCTMNGRPGPAPTTTDSELPPCDQQIQIAMADGHRMRSVVTAEPGRGDGFLLQFAAFNEHDLLVEKYLICISSSNHHAFVALISGSNGFMEYLSQCTWSQQLRAFVQKIVYRVSVGQAFSTDPTNAVARDDFLAQYNHAKTWLEESLHAQPSSLEKARNFRCLAVLKQEILNQFTQHGKNFSNVFYINRANPAMPPDVVDFLDGTVLPKIRQLEQMRPKMCSWCAKSGDNYKHCSRCGLAYYCSLVCQKAHWENHRKTCKAPDADALTIMFNSI